MIVTVSCELAALGDETARELAKLQGSRFVGKDALEDRIKSFGIESSKLKKYEGRKPSFFASLSHDRDDYLHYLKTAVFTEAEQGDCVFISSGVGMVFKNLPGHISLFLASPLGIRIERVKSYFQCDERRARQIIERSDQDRVGFHRYFFDIDWRDPGNYHICLNTGVLRPADCAEIVNKFKDRFLSAEEAAKSAARLKELILEQRIKHIIAYEQGIAIHFLEVSVSGNIVILYGVTNSQALVDAAINTVKDIDEVIDNLLEVRGEIQIVREEYGVIP